MTREELHDYNLQLRNEIDDISGRLATNAHMVGFFGSIAAKFSGTEAYGFSLSLHGLAENLARQKARELAIASDGDTLLGTSSSWECRTLSVSVASLDRSQSQPALLANLSQARLHLEKEDLIWRLEPKTGPASLISLPKTLQ